MALVDTPIPKKLRDLRGFVGLANWQRTFVAKFSEEIKPLQESIQKQAEVTKQTSQNYGLKSTRKRSDK